MIQIPRIFDQIRGSIICAKHGLSDPSKWISILLSVCLSASFMYQTIPYHTIQKKLYHMSDHTGTLPYHTVTKNTVRTKYQKIPHPPIPCYTIPYPYRTTYQIIPYPYQTIQYPYPALPCRTIRVVAPTHKPRITWSTSTEDIPRTSQSTSTTGSHAHS